METYEHYLGFAISMMQEMSERNEQKLKEIQEEWWKSMEYPRKKKKTVRKHLLLEWSIFSWSKETYGF
jgi:hypothetical protein